jgi:micrococcal nuclease
MKTTKSILSVLLLAISIQTFALYGRVVGVQDGDSFTLLDDNNVQYKIRLHGIDCPELNQPFGKAAKQFVSDLIFGQYVNVETNKKDRYGRTIGIVTLANHSILNEAILKNGYAWHYLEYDNNPVWNDLESIAKSNKLGLWAGLNPIEPWVWRKMKK